MTAPDLRKPRYDLTSLQVFVSVAESGNLTRAAEREHLAVSAISKRMTELEETAGVPLLQRLPRGVALTPAGESLLRHARTLLSQLRTLDAELQTFAAGLRGHLRLHAIASAFAQSLAAEVESFLQQHPAVELSIQERTGSAIVKAVAAGKADVGVVAARTPAGGLCTLPYCEDQLVLAVPLQHPLARRSSVVFAEALDWPFIGPHAESSLADQMNEAATAAGKPLRLQVRANGFDAMIRLVQARLGVALLPAGAVQREAQARRLRSVALQDAWATRQLVLVVRDPDRLDPIARTLIQHLQAGRGGGR